MQYCSLNVLFWDIGDSTPTLEANVDFITWSRP
jgi:hypothetical protein